MDVEGAMKGDKLVLRGLLFHGFHGVKPEEKTLGQKFAIDVDAWLDLRAAGKSDNLSDTVSYTEIYRIVKEVLEGPSHDLLESVAHTIAIRTLTKFSQITAVRVKVGKPHVAVHGTIDYLGIEITSFATFVSSKREAKELFNVSDDNGGVPWELWNEANVWASTANDWCVKF